ncbi:Fe-S cluster assembly protein SufD [Balneolales bacterium ANBcel1]|nr:Fe-S cluster assembly protein SufD [Balneolales bacterium ANBcel1]
MSDITKETVFLDRLIGNFGQIEPLHPKLAELQEEARREVSGKELPTPRHEEWKYCNLKSLDNETFVPPAEIKTPNLPDDVSGYIYPEAEHHHLTFINGVYSAQYSKTDQLPEGVIVANLADVLRDGNEVALEHLGRYAKWEDDPFAPLNTAVFRDGAFIYVPKSVKIEEPIQLLFINTDENKQYMLAPRSLIVGDRSSEMTVVEDHIGLGDNVYFNSPVSEIKLAENSHMTHVKLQRDSRNAYHISRLAADISRDSDYKSYAVQLGAHLSRSDVKAVLTDENTHATLDGLVMVNGDQLSDTHSIMDHTMPNCTSHQLHKCIIDGDGTSVFNGKIFVRQDAQKTDAFQENRNLQLSDTGTAYAKPQLEIFADDVSCSHGATIGQLNPEEVFYLKTRGLREAQTREILTYGFALNVIESIPVDSIQKRLSKEVENFTRQSKSIKQYA